MKKKETTKKTNWFKRLLKIFMWLIILLIAAVIAIYLCLGCIVKKAVTSVVPPITGTSASVDDVDLSLLKGHVAIKGFKIGNPAGFATQNIFELGSVVVDFDLKSVFSNKIIIKQILIDKTAADAEINKNGEINLVLIQKNVENYLNAGKTTPADPASETKAQTKTQTKSDSGKKVVIKKLNIDNSKLTLGALGQTIDLNLPNIHKTGIGEDQKKQYTLPETIALILSYFSESSVTAVMNSGNELFKKSLADTKALLNNTADAAKQQIDAAKQQVDEAKAKTKELSDNVKNIGSSVKDNVKDLGSMFKK